MINALLVAAALAGSIALPRYEAGDAFIFTGGKVERVRRTEGQVVVWSGRGMAQWKRSANPIVPILEWKFMNGEGRRKVGGNPDALWPLERGRAVRFRIVTEVVRDKRHLRSVSLWSCSVGTIAPVEVPAGVFDAFPIICDRYSASNMRLAERVLTDWSPDVGHYVRRRSTLYATGATTDARLVAALSGESATTARISALAEQAARN